MKAKIMYYNALLYSTLLLIYIFIYLFCYLQRSYTQSCHFCYHFATKQVVRLFMRLYLWVSELSLSTSSKIIQYLSGTRIHNSIFFQVLRYLLWTPRQPNGEYYCICCCCCYKISELPKFWALFKLFFIGILMLWLNYPKFYIYRSLKGLLLVDIFGELE